MFSGLSLEQIDLNLVKIIRCLPRVGGGGEYCACRLSGP
jgi:hypothetical protein